MSIVIAGASGGIGHALFKQLIHQSTKQVYGISRQKLRECDLQADLSGPDQIDKVRDFLNHIQVSEIYCCAGVLHEDINMPEKMLSQIRDEWIYKSLSQNVMTHVHLAQALAPILNKNYDLKWLSLSAKVGSLEDNSLGGWYSYRMTKAALNMFIKNLSIEWARKSSNILVASIHPGTTDSELSKPFQRNISPEKLYSAEQTADRLIAVMNNLSKHQHGKLLNWDGQLLPY